MATQIKKKDITPSIIDNTLLSSDYQSLAKVSNSKLKLTSSSATEVTLDGSLRTTTAGGYLDAPILKESGTDIKNTYAKLSGSTLTGEMKWAITTGGAPGLSWEGLNDSHKVFLEYTGGSTKLVLQSGDDGDTDYTVFRNMLGTTPTDILEIRNTYVQINKELRMNSQKISGLATPSLNTDASTKKYVDDSVSDHAALATSTSVSGHVKFDTTVPANIAASGSVGSAVTAARRDHVHGHGTFSSGDYHTIYYKKAGDTISGTINMNSQLIDNAKEINIYAPGRGRGLTWDGTNAGWMIDVAPTARGSDTDGDLHLYGTANNIILHRPVIAKSTMSIDSNLTVSGTGTSSFAGNATFGGVSVSGSLVVGATSPSNKLTVVGDHASSIIRLHADNGVNSHANLYMWASEPNKHYYSCGIGSNWRYSGGWGRQDTNLGASYIQLKDDRVQIYTVDTANVETLGLTVYRGNIAIGVGATNSRLEIKSGQDYNHLALSGSLPMIKFKADSYNSTNGAEILQEANGTLKINTNSTTNAITALANGNLGVGRTSPSQKLDVGGAIAINGTTVIDSSRNATVSKLTTSYIANSSSVKFTNGASAQGIEVKSLLASDLFADSSKVPTNGIYSKGQIYTDGHIRNSKGATSISFTAGTATLSQTFTHNYGSTNYIVLLTPSSPTRHCYYTSKAANSVSICIDDIPTENITIDVLIIGT